MDCTIYVVKTKVLINCRIIEQLICTFVFAYICKKAGFLLTLLNNWSMPMSNLHKTKVGVFIKSASGDSSNDNPQLMFS